MKHIIKKYIAPNEPQELTDFKKKVSQSLKSPNLQKNQAEVWEKFKKPKEPKNTIKSLLVEEQGYICCYCLQKIEIDKDTQIEHLIPRRKDAKKMFDYDNLLACCKGGEEERQTNKLFPMYCGANKSDDILDITPLQPDCEQFFSYEIVDNTDDALFIKIVGKTPEATQTIDTLNLDCAYLREQRGAAIIPFLDDENPISKEEVNALLDKITGKINGKFQPFCTAIKYFLAKLAENLETTEE